jgi:hypothetical protein
MLQLESGNFAVAGGSSLPQKHSELENKLRKSRIAIEKSQKMINTYEY